MRRAYAFWFLILSFFLNGGLTLEYHYCMGEFASVGYWQEAGTCDASCVEEVSVPNDFEQTPFALDGTSCCALDHVHSLCSEMSAATDLNLPGISESLPVITEVPSSAVCSVELDPDLGVRPPPDVKHSELHKQLCTYRI